jgi:hypothetical protein
MQGHSLLNQRTRRSGTPWEDEPQYSLCTWFQNASSLLLPSCSACQHSLHGITLGSVTEVLTHSHANAPCESKVGLRMQRDMRPGRSARASVTGGLAAAFFFEDEGVEEGEEGVPHLRERGGGGDGGFRFGGGYAWRTDDVSEESSLAYQRWPRSSCVT